MIKGKPQKVSSRHNIATNIHDFAMDSDTNHPIGWDEGVLSVDGGMTLGEKATLTITG